MTRRSWTTKDITYFTNLFREMGRAGWRDATEAAGIDGESPPVDELLVLARRDTDLVLELVATRARELEIGTVVIASTTGCSARRAADVLSGLRLIAVTHHAGFDEPDMLSFSRDDREAFTRAGGTVLVSRHAFSELGGRQGRIPAQFLGIGDVVANTLRIFGDGMKVACEIILMAADAGLVRTDEDVISIAGNGRGVNTAIVVSPVNSKDFFSLLVKEILCKPHFEGLHGWDIAPPT